MIAKKMRAEFEVYMRDVVKCVVGSSDPYPAGIERREWATWRSAWQASRTAQSVSTGSATVQVDPDAPPLTLATFSTPAPVEPAESGDDEQLDKMTTLRFRRLCNAIGYPDPTDGAETMSVELLFSSFGAMASMLERAASIGAGDAEASRTAQSEVVATADQCIDLAIALEQRRALKIVADVRALRLGKGPDPMMPTQEESFFDLACEEIETRLRTEKWSLNGVDMPLPAQSEAKTVAFRDEGDEQLKERINVEQPAYEAFLKSRPVRYEGHEFSAGFWAAWSYLKAATPAPVEPADQYCQNCGGSGDVHTIDGEWRGECPVCKDAPIDTAPPVAAPVEVVGLEPDHRLEACPRCEGWGVINVFGIEEKWEESCPECRGAALAQRGEKT